MGEVRLWELRSRELISHLKEHKQKITSLVLFEDDAMAFSASRDRCILRWDLKTEVLWYITFLVLTLNFCGLLSGRSVLKAPYYPRTFKLDIAYYDENNIILIINIVIIIQRSVACIATCSEWVD